MEYKDYKLTLFDWSNIEKEPNPTNTLFGWGASLPSGVLNQRTNQYEYVDYLNFANTEPLRLLDYMPQIPPLHGMYKIYLELGVPALKAYQACLLRSLGQVDEADAIVNPYINGGEVS